MRILVIEDEKIILDGIVLNLQQAGYAVDASMTGSVGLELAMINTYDVILLDVNLPDMLGYQLCEKLRKAEIVTPIIMVTARNEVVDRIHGLDIGADDYLIKPFEFAELQARIRAVLRRNMSKQNPQLVVGDILLTPVLYQVLINKQEVNLTKKEYEILYYLMLTHPKPQSLEQIIEHVWDDEVNPFSNAARVHITNLRKKIRTLTTTSVIEMKKEMGYYIWTTH